jgi:LysM repeat protein
MPGNNPYNPYYYQQPTPPKEPKGDGFWAGVYNANEKFATWAGDASVPQIAALGLVAPPLAAWAGFLHGAPKAMEWATKNDEPYQFKPDDDVTKIAQQFNTTPAAILQANPGAYPFTTGQNIKLPTQPQQPMVQNQPGAAPFGVNLAGQRLDASGNAWDPATAKTDIYGGQFIQPGQKKWERINGKLRRVQYGAGGKKTILKGGNKDAAPLGSDPQAVSNAFIRFGVSSG